MTDVPAEVIAHYQEDEEHLRLTEPKGRVQLLRTQRLLQAVLPPAPARVLDVGGGTGVYASWLTGLGYEVEVIDPTPVHIDRCAAQGLHAEIGDARSLPRDDAVYDVVLLLGPLYHLPERDDRVLALREAHRVLKPGGVLGAAVISRFAGWLDGLLRRVDALEQHRPLVEQELVDGRHVTPEGTDLFTTAYFHHPDELAPELLEAGFTDVHVRAIEGPTWLMSSVETVGAERIVELIGPIDREPSLIGASAHLLATARKISAH